MSAIPFYRKVIAVTRWSDKRSFGIKRNLIQISLLVVVLLQTLAIDAQTVTMIAAGGGHSLYAEGGHSLFLKSDGSLWAMGWNANGELGDGTYNSTDHPKQIVASNVTAIAAGGYHSLFLMSDGSLWAMGDNEFGELGDGTYRSTNQPKQIVASNVTAIAAGYYHSLFLKGDGSLWAMGYNVHGELGDGTTDNGNYETNCPEQIVASNVTAIAAGDFHSLFLKSDGSLWAMGDNEDGALGDGTHNETNLGVTSPEQIVASGVKAIAGGGYHSLFLKSDRSLWGMGWNICGQLGDGPSTHETDWPEQIVASNVTAIAAGYGHSLFIKCDGSLWAMGFNQRGQLGDGTYDTPFPYGTNYPEQIVASNITAIAAGDFHSLFLTSDASLWAMGSDNEGQLGDGTYGTLPYYGTNLPELVVAGSIMPPGYNQIAVQLLSGGKVQLSFVGIAGKHYALEHSLSLVPTIWVPQVTNTASASGGLVFTNTPDPTTNIFWRVRALP